MTTRRQSADVGFDINLEWVGADEDDPLLRATAAEVTIRVGETVLTRGIDVFAQTIRQSPRLSGYWLAAWLASSWWRLRYEPWDQGYCLTEAI